MVSNFSKRHEYVRDKSAITRKKPPALRVGSLRGEKNKKYTMKENHWKLLFRINLHGKKIQQKKAQKKKERKKERKRRKRGRRRRGKRMRSVNRSNRESIGCHVEQSTFLQMGNVQEEDV